MQRVLTAVKGTDEDRDRAPALTDCDDHDPTRSPLEFDLPCNGLDENCNGFDECDTDRDGYDDTIDCNPHDPQITCECMPCPRAPRLPR